MEIILTIILGTLLQTAVIEAPNIVGALVGPYTRVMEPGPTLIWIDPAQESEIPF